MNPLRTEKNVAEGELFGWLVRWAEVGKTVLTIMLIIALCIERRLLGG